MFNKAELTVPCPDCGQKHTKTIGWIQTHDQFTCERCGERIHLDHDHLLAGLEKLDKTIADLRKSLGSFGKKR
ncbi:Transposase OS=Bosea thiooxidans OX=53254 GN=SAMN05660750_03320 PE=4 SV=1 [Bosea thiooxidans]|uniref:Uncharacterized protein n=1 Tax=Bosea thiooxidans TaxID=53254 RepID=A0A1T5FKY6_9HYPH|nr:hypothetical protein SAMN05660750_03320 [Bosea thiooxidans]